MTGSVVAPAIWAVESAERIAAVGVARDGSLLVAEIEAVLVVGVKKFSGLHNFLFFFVDCRMLCHVPQGTARCWEL